MQHLPTLGLSFILLSAPVLACGGGVSEATPIPHDSVSTERPDDTLTDRERRKIDARLASHWDKGQEPLPIKVRFEVTPSDSVLADLLLTRVGAVVVGQVTRDGLKRILAREDVEQVTYYSGAGYDDDLG